MINQISRFNNSLKIELTTFLDLSHITVKVIDDFLSSVESGKNIIDSRALFQVVIGFIPLFEFYDEFIKLGGRDMLAEVIDNQYLEEGTILYEEVLQYLN